MKAKKILLWTGIILVIIVATFAIVLYPSFHSFFKTETIQMDKDLTIVKGGGGNSGILVTDSAIVVIDTKMGKSAETLFNLAKEKAGHKKIIVINTHYHGDHVNGNKFYTGSTIYIGNYDTSFILKEMKPEDMPTNFVRDSLALNCGSEIVLLCNLGQAHTYEDMVVYLNNRKLLFSGDLVFNKMNPVLKKNGGADVDKWITALDIILNRWEIKTLVPGHGKPGGKELAEALKQYFIDMKTAAVNPDRESEIKAKYTDWTTMPMMASPDKTIQFLKNK